MIVFKTQEAQQFFTKFKRDVINIGVFISEDEDIDKGLIDFLNFSLLGKFLEFNIADIVYIPDNEVATYVNVEKPRSKSYTRLKNKKIF